jgi:hypothetical protein
MFASLIRRFRIPERPPRRALFIDDVTAGDIEILPLSELDWCREQITAIAAARTPGAHGFEEVTVRRLRDGALSVADLAIPFEAARQALATRLTPFDAVVTGDPNQPTRTRGKGYGPSPLSAVVIYAADGAETITALEVSLRGNPSETIAVLSAIAALPSPQPLIAADWAGLGVVELADPSAVRRFANRAN